MVVGQDVLAERDSKLLMQAADAAAQRVDRAASVVVSGHTHAPCFITVPALAGGNSSILHATLSASGWRMRPDASFALLFLHDRASVASSISLLPLPHEHLCIAAIIAACAAVVAVIFDICKGAGWSLKRQKAS
jgi:hypothetical protein